MVKAKRPAILLVEDNYDEAELAKLAIESGGFDGQTIWLKSGEDVLDFFSDLSNNELIKRIELVLLDLNLPKMNGIEVLKFIKRSTSSKHLPVVMLTTSKEKEDLVSAYNNHVNSYMVKPVAFDDFQEMIYSIYEYWTEYNTQITS